MLNLRGIFHVHTCVIKYMYKSASTTVTKLGHLITYNVFYIRINKHTKIIIYRRVVAVRRLSMERQTSATSENGSPQRK